MVPVASVDKEQRDLEVVQARLNSMDAQIAAQKEVILKTKRRIDEAKDRKTIGERAIAFLLNSISIQRCRGKHSGQSWRFCQSANETYSS